MKTTKLSDQSCGKVAAAIIFLRESRQFRDEFWSLEQFKALWRALFVSYAPEMCRPADPKVVTRLKRTSQEVNFIPACRVLGKQTGRELYDRRGGHCTLRPIRAWITSPTIDPEDAFAITFRIDSAPRRSCLTALQELASAPSCLRMDSVGYAGVTYYCLRSVFDKEQERDGDNLLDELCSDPEFASQAWTKDDFCTIWYWVQRASAVFPCEGGRLEASFTFDVTTSAGRILKFNTNSADAVVCGKAHVRLKKMEAAGDSITEEVKLMRNTSPVYWREVFQDRRQYCGVPNDEAGVLLERPQKRVRSKMSRDNCCRRVEVRSLERDEDGTWRDTTRHPDYEDRARWGTARAARAREVATKKALEAAQEKAQRERQERERQERVAKAMGGDEQEANRAECSSRLCWPPASLSESMSCGSCVRLHQ